MLGRTLSGRYRIERIIGEGGMGTVYSVEHMHMRKRLAVKILHPEMSRLPEFVARFEREAMAAAHIDHPNVAAATDFGKLDDGSFFLVLEYVEGKSLRDAIALGRLELGRALHVMGQIASALGRAHAIGIVHRDLKPENVMLVQREEDADFVKVLDFGIAKVPVGELSAFERKDGPAQPALTQLGMVYGTPEYMAPEQALGQSVDRRADLYALGIIAYEMLVGSRPFDHESKVTLLGMHVTAPVRPMSDVAPDAKVPPEIEAIVARLLAKEAGQRFSDARELLETMGATLLELATEGRIDEALLEKALGASSPLHSGLRSPILASRASLVSVGALANDGGRRSADPSALLESTPSVSRVAPSYMSALRRVSGKTWAIGAGSLGAVVFLVLFVAVLGHGAAEVAPATADAAVTKLTPSPDATVKMQGTALVEQQIASAEQRVAQGDASEAIKLLVPLEQANPMRADVHRALERAFAAEHDTKSALREAEQWLAADPAAAGDRHLAEDLRAAALGKDEPEEALGLLESKLGSAGADILYDLAYGGKSPAAIAARAHQALQSPEVRGHASAAVLVSLDLRSATSCEARRALLPRAREVGDARTVTILSAYAPTTGCGFLHGHDCWPCLHRDGLLGATIGAITARSSASP
jgi:serine/threonine-protein kinase